MYKLCLIGVNIIIKVIIFNNKNSVIRGLICRYNTITPIKLHLKLSITKRHCRPLTLRNPYKTPEHELREKRSN
jgi:hypothetical protein